MKSDSGGPNKKTTDQIKDFVDNWLTSNQVPGASVAITTSDKVLFEKGFGARHLQSNVATTPETLYGIASATKPFTAMAIMQLAESGQLSISDPISEYVDFLKSAPGDNITIKELLSHTSGMPSDEIAMVLHPRLSIGQGLTTPLSSREDLHRHVNQAAERRITDQNRCIYYNTGYVILGRIIESISGESYATYIESEILDPLGMDRTTFHQVDFKTEEDKMTPYTQTEDGLEATKVGFEEHFHPSGGLLSSVSDISRFLRACMNGGKFDGVQLLDESSLAAMTERYGHMRTLIDGTTEYYGLGLTRHKCMDDTLIGHGGTIASSAYLGYLKNAGFGVALLCNTVPETHPIEVGPAILGLVQGVKPIEANPYYAVRKRIEKVEGTYKSYRGIQTATVKPDGLILKIKLTSPMDETEFTCFPESTEPVAYNFYTISPKYHRIPVEFVFSEDSIDLLILDNRFKKE